MKLTRRKRWLLAIPLLLLVVIAIQGRNSRLRRWMPGTWQSARYPDMKLQISAARDGETFKIKHHSSYYETNYLFTVVDADHIRIGEPSGPWRTLQVSFDSSGRMSLDDPPGELTWIRVR